MPHVLAVHLLGEPSVARDGRRQPAPRGQKAWALLAYLLATDSAPSREWLAELLFPEADDPLNALSWNLSQLRRLLGAETRLEGRRIELHLPAGSMVDTQVLTRGTWMEALRLPGLGRELLQGMASPTSPGFEAWLLAERRHLEGTAQSVLREAARAMLAAGDAGRAIKLAGRLVAGDPLDEDAQELLIRAYAAAGDRIAARQQLAACLAVFRRELGTAPGQAVLRAADEEPVEPARRPGRPASIDAHLEAGLAALDAGAVDAGIAALRGAVAEAHEAGDQGREGSALLALGSALVHGVRGRDGEGASMLHQAIGLIAPEEPAAAEARRELGYVETLRGRYDRAGRWLREATALAAGDPEQQAWARAVRGIALTDVGRHGAALTELRAAASAAQVVGAERVEAWALTFAGRVHLLREELAEARVALGRSLELARRLRWTALIPLPEALLAEVDLREGHIEAAAAAFEHAYALALQLGDPCWEGVAGRGLGLVAARRGDQEAALRWVTEARTRCVRLPDAWLWVEAYCLDTLCHLAVEQRREEATRWVGDLEALASRTGMRELAVRAYLHRARLGDGDARQAARVLAADVDNPALDRLL